MRVRLTVMRAVAESRGVDFCAPRLYLVMNAKPSLSRRSSPGGKDVGSQGSKSEPSVPTTITVLGDRRVRLDLGASTEDRIREIADAQRARMTRVQLLAAGVSRCAIQRRVRNGCLEVIHRAVYGLPH